jgi:solute carrier family 35 protein E2
MKWMLDQLVGGNPRALVFLILWYFFSGCTLFLNKHIISHMKGDPLILATSQMLMTLLFGFAHLLFPVGMHPPVERKSTPPDCVRNMVIVGTLRFTTVFLGLIALKFIEVSFTETVKSTAPAFTVILSRLVVGEVTGPLVKLSLIPVMGGLALCSANELSFNLFGFIASLSTNISECSENVCSKLLISGKGHKYTPAELQYYSSLASFAVQERIL